VVSAKNKMAFSLFTPDPNADPLHQVTLLLPWALKIWVIYSVGIFVSFIGWALLAFALIKLLSLASPVSEKTIVRNPFRKLAIEELATAQLLKVNLFTLFSVAHGLITVALIFWYQSSSLWRPFLLATGALNTILFTLFVIFLVIVLTARILGIPLETRNMGGGQRWPDLEKADRSQEDARSKKARCEADEPSPETKPTGVTSNIHLFTSPQPTYIPMASGIPTNQTTAVIDSYDTENDAMGTDSATKLLLNNGIDPNTLSPVQIRAFRAQDPTVQLKSVQVYKASLARMAYLQTPSRKTPAHDCCHPDVGFDIKPSDLMVFPEASPYAIPSNREAEMSHLATMRESHLQQETSRVVQMQEQLLAAQALLREGASIVEQAHNNAVAAAQPVIDSQMPLKLDGGIYKSKAPNDHRRPTDIGYHPPDAANLASQNYEMQLMLLEQQSRKRYAMARVEQVKASRRAEEQA